MQHKMRHLRNMQHRIPSMCCTIDFTLHFLGISFIKTLTTYRILYELIQFSKFETESSRENFI
jgi:hypothetical protein